MSIPKTELSILIPVFNQDCMPMVERLTEMCSAVDGLAYEIIVGDDCSTDEVLKTRNQEIKRLSHCRYEERSINGGAGATRNFLVGKSRYEWLLFLDCDMELPDDRFILNYLERPETTVINGGIRIESNKESGMPEGTEYDNNLRYLYEHKESPNHTAEARSRNPHKSFRSTNFLAARKVMQENPFYEPMRRYEDVYFGRILCERNIDITHIDNPVVITRFDTNEEYILKVEKDMTMLAAFQKELTGYSPLLSAATTMRKWVVPAWMMHLFHNIFGKSIRNNLVSDKPNLSLLNIYKLGFFLVTVNN